MHKCMAKNLRGIDGKIIMENRERLVVWKEYTNELFEHGQQYETQNPGSGKWE